MEWLICKTGNNRNRGGMRWTDQIWSKCRMLKYNKIKEDLLMRKKNAIVMIGMIVMIISVFVLFRGQLSAEEVAGTSIFTQIETPHPYPQAEKNQTLVWSTTIDQPNATWIKIHFSNFQLNDKDFVNLIDDKGRIIEHIQLENIKEKHKAYLKSKENVAPMINFWASAVDGQKIKIELHRGSNAPLIARGFTIDEIGIGTKPIYEKGLEPIANDNPDIEGDFINFLVNKSQNFKLNQAITPEQISGRMLYKKGSTWYTSKGILLNSNSNQFLPNENCIDSQDVVNNLEVRFYSHYYQDNTDCPAYQSFHGDRLIDNYSSNNHGLISLKKSLKLEAFDLTNGQSVDKSELSSILSGTCVYCCLFLKECHWHYPPPPLRPYKHCIIIACLMECECTCPCCCCSI